MSGHDMQRGQVTRRRFLQGAAVAGAGLALYGPGRALAAMAPAPQGIEATVPTLLTRTPGKFSLLAVTDLHFYITQIAPEPKTVEDIRKMIHVFDPDLLVVTGDMWHNNPGGRGYSFCKWACKQFSDLPVPWAFAWGNHDQMDDYNQGHKLLTHAPNSMYAGAAADGNYRIAVRDAAGATPVWNLVFLNDSRGGIQAEQVQWFNAEAARIKTSDPAPAFLFFHIPIPQYLDIAMPGRAKGVMYEGVAHDGGDHAALQAFHDSGLVRAMFCGHDHVNDYEGKLKGVHIEYLRATGREGYGGDRVPKGGTLITVDAAAGTFDSVTVFPDGSRWTPDAFDMKIG